jgi:hypothetical protein
MEPMAYVPQRPPIAPAYNIFCSAMKLEAKDSGINAKSGNIALTFLKLFSGYNSNVLPFYH